jgi:VanZ family protein
MTLIFIASADAESGPRGSRLLVPLLRWLNPDISPDSIEQITLVARKGIHFVTYAILALLAWHALSTRHPGRWRTRTGLQALALAVVYAMSDEIHQSFVPTRVGSKLDVVIDTAGAATALGLCRAWTTRRSRR